MSASYELFINYGSRNARLHADSLIISLKKNGISLSKIHKIKNPRLIHKKISKILESPPTHLIVASGDGTISEIVDHLVNKDINLCIIPFGTTNNFARSLKIPADINESIRIIKQNKISQIDLGNINNDYFANVAGVGISALVAKTVTNKNKKRYGRAAYALVGLKTLINHKSFEVVVSDKDNELLLQFETHQIIIANGRYHAGKKIAEGASLKSRELVVFKLGGKSKLSFIWHMLDFYIGKRKNISHSSYLIAKNITIRTNTQQSVEIDGEVKTKTPLSAVVMPKSLRVVC